MITLVRFPFISSAGSINNEPSPPIGLAYISGSLKKAGFQVEGVDASGEALDDFRPIEGTELQYNGLNIEEIIEKINPATKIIGVSATFSHEWVYVKQGIHKLAEHFPNAVIIGGGEHFNAIPEYSLRDCPALNYICMGEGEETLVEFCDLVVKGQKPDSIKGISYLSGNDFVQTEPRKRIKDVDSIPWPNWEIFPLESYFERSKSYGASFGRNMPMMLSRGCPYQCTFCSNPQMWTTAYYLRSVDDVINEMIYYKEKYNITGFQFYDLTAIIKRDWIIEFCKAMIDRKIDLAWSLPTGTRSEALDDEALGWLTKAKLSYLCYAPESASEKTLKLIKKKISFDKMVKSIRSAIRLNLVLRTNFIIGFPHETRSDVLTTVRGALKMAFIGVDESPLFFFQPYPGMELFDYLVKNNRVKLNDSYFNSLATVSTGKFSPPDFSFSEHVGKTELWFYRFATTIMVILISYLVRPKRILRSIHNIFFSDKSATVIEQRLKDQIRALTTPGSKTKGAKEAIGALDKSIAKTS